MKKIIIIILTLISIIVNSCKVVDDTLYYASNDAEIKKISFENKLSEIQVFVLLEKPVEEQIDLNVDSFGINKHTLKTCITAQIILETGHMKSELVQINNILGIKKLKLRPYFTKHTNEYDKNDKKSYKKQKFASFYSISDCLHNYFTILSKKRFKRVRSATDYRDYCIALQKCGYATDPRYAIKLIDIIKTLKSQMTPDILGNEFNKR